MLVATGYYNKSVVVRQRIRYRFFRIASISDSNVSATVRAWFRVASDIRGSSAIRQWTASAALRSRADNAAAFRTAYRRYVWPTDGLDGVQVAPFQVLATEGRTYHDRDHGWHLGVADRLVDAAPSLVRLLGLSSDQVRRLARAGDLPSAFTVGPDGMRAYRREDVEALLARRRGSASTEPPA